MDGFDNNNLGPRKTSELIPKVTPASPTTMSEDGTIVQPSSNSNNPHGTSSLLPTIRQEEQQQDTNRQVTDYSWQPVYNPPVTPQLLNKIVESGRAKSMQYPQPAKGSTQLVLSTKQISQPPTEESAAPPPPPPPATIPIQAMPQGLPKSFPLQQIDLVETPQSKVRQQTQTTNQQQSQAPLNMVESSLSQSKSGTFQSKDSPVVNSASIQDSTRLSNTSSGPSSLTSSSSHEESASANSAHGDIQQHQRQVTEKLINNDPQTDDHPRIISSANATVLHRSPKAEILTAPPAFKFAANLSDQEKRSLVDILLKSSSTDHSMTQQQVALAKKIPPQLDERSFSTSNETSASNRSLDQSQEPSESTRNSRRGEGERLHHTDHKQQRFDSHRQQLLNIDDNSIKGHLINLIEPEPCYDSACLIQPRPIAVITGSLSNQNQPLPPLLQPMVTSKQAVIMNRRSRSLNRNVISRSSPDHHEQIIGNNNNKEQRLMISRSITPAHQSRPRTRDQSVAIEHTRPIRFNYEHVDFAEALAYTKGTLSGLVCGLTFTMLYLTIGLISSSRKYNLRLIGDRAVQDGFISLRDTFSDSLNWIIYIMLVIFDTLFLLYIPNDNLSFAIYLTVFSSILLFVCLIIFMVIVSMSSFFGFTMLILIVPPLLLLLRSIPLVYFIYKKSEVWMPAAYWNSQRDHHHHYVRTRKVGVTSDGRADIRDIVKHEGSNRGNFQQHQANEMHLQHRTHSDTERIESTISQDNLGGGAGAMRLPISSIPSTSASPVTRSSHRSKSRSHTRGTKQRRRPRSAKSGHSNRSKRSLRTRSPAIVSDGSQAKTLSLKSKQSENDSSRTPSFVTPSSVTPPSASFSGASSKTINISESITPTATYSQPGKASGNIQRQEQQTHQVEKPSITEAGQQYPKTVARASGARQKADRNTSLSQNAKMSQEQQNRAPPSALTAGPVKMEARSQAMPYTPYRVGSLYFAAYNFLDWDGQMNLNPILPEYFQEQHIDIACKLSMMQGFIVGISEAAIITLTFLLSFAGCLKQANIKFVLDDDWLYVQDSLNTLMNEIRPAQTLTICLFLLWATVVFFLLMKSENVYLAIVCEVGVLSVLIASITVLSQAAMENSSLVILLIVVLFFSTVVSLATLIVLAFTLKKQEIWPVPEEPLWRRICC